MKKNITLFSVGLMLFLFGVSAQAQTGRVVGGSFAVNFRQMFLDTLTAQNVSVKYRSYGTDGFAVTSGSANAGTAALTVQSTGTIVFATPQGKIRLQNLEVTSDGVNSYIMAHVVVSGTDEGVFPVFAITSIGVPTASTVSTKVQEVMYSGLKFTINPDFISDFSDMFDFSGFDPTEVIGTVSLDIDVKS